ncbi:hypothetical protein OIU78_026681 [Salix suchowensis]|nr:hypothetical protein OIU78_026681 [Salix suchowensis]
MALHLLVRKLVCMFIALFHIYTYPVRKYRLIEIRKANN